MTDLAAVLSAFRAATQCDAAVWTRASDGKFVKYASTDGAPALSACPALSDGIREVNTGQERVLVAAVPGTRRAWLELGPCDVLQADLESYMRFMLPVVAQYLQSALEVEHAANELAERYEEINLLYTISEILGRTVSLEEAARTILTEISETVGARRASILVHDPSSDTLRVVAALGADASLTSAIAGQDPCSVSARGFRTQHPMLVEAGQMKTDAEAACRRGAM